MLSECLVGLLDLLKKEAKEPRTNLAVRQLSCQLSRSNGRFMMLVFAWELLTSGVVLWMCILKVYS